MLSRRVLLNALLILLLVASAMSLVTAQHRSRYVFVDMERAKNEARHMEQRWSQWQSEQTAAARHSNIEKIARSQLSMQPVTPDRAQYIVKTAEVIR